MRPSAARTRPSRPHGRVHGGAQPPTPSYRADGTVAKMSRFSIQRFGASGADHCCRSAVNSGISPQPSATEPNMS